MEPPAHFKILVFMALSLLFQSSHCSGFSLFPGNPRKYRAGDSLSLEVTSLVSYMHLPLSYYSLPFCKPQEGLKGKALNLGQLLMGDRIHNSPFRIKMNNNGSIVFLCQSGPLSAAEVDLWKKKIDQVYYIHFLLDDLPAMKYVKSQLFSFQSLGIEVGSKFYKTYYVFNHLEFKVLVHKEANNNNMVTDGDPNEGSGVPMYTVVGFEVTPCSVNHDPQAANLTMYDEYIYPVRGSCIVESKEIKENESITFTYSVTFEESDINWTSRWDVYSLADGSSVRLSSLINSLISTALLSVYVLLIFRRSATQNQAQSGVLDAEANVPLIQKSFGPCKFVMEDVLRAPDSPMLLCAAIGTGVQILGVAVLAVTLAALGFLSSAPRGTLLMLMMFLYTILSFAAGLVATSAWRTLGCAHQKGWISVSIRVACIFPGIALLILASKHFLLGTSSDSDDTAGTTPFHLLIFLTLLWLGISLPLTLIGGYIGSKSHHKDASSPTNGTPGKNIPRTISKLRSFLFFALAGSLCFSVLIIQLSFILTSLRTGFIYNHYGFLWIALTLLLLVCSETSIIFVYKCLVVGDSRWWWKSFVAAASVAIYLFGYLIYRLVYDDLWFMSGPGQVAIYIGYIVIISLATMFATGAAGLLSTFWFLRYVVFR